MQNRRSEYALPQVHRRPKGQSDHDYVEDLRAQGPVAVDRYGFYWIFSHDHMLRAADPALTRQVETEKIRALGLTSGPEYDYFANSLLFSNEEVHARRRRPLAPGFAFSLMEALRPRVRSVAEGLVQSALSQRETDFLDMISGPLPARIVAEVLGVATGDAAWFTGRVYLAMRALSLRPAEQSADATAALGDLNEYVSQLLVDRRRAPGSDFLTDFLARADDGGLTADEARVQITSVILAGSDTTRMALASTLSQLLQHPDQWAEVTRDPDGQKGPAVAEGLRFDPVIGSLPRVAAADFELDGVPVRSGTVLAPIVVAILRDPAVYGDPARFEIHRTDHPRHHPVFGAGAHRCLGEALARIELEEGLSAIARLAPGVTLAGPRPTLRGVSGARTIDEMRVRLG